MTVIVMGVAGCGKSTTGKLLAEQLSLPFIEADDFHSKENVLKMSKGIPLNDEDRYPWLQSLAHELQLQEGKKGAVLACSALKESYRKILQDGLKEKIAWVYLEGDEQILKERLKNRKGHFMPEELLQSQLATLEKPDGAHTFSITMNPQEIVDDIMKVIKQ
jgi:carbohydrate kinase (thermoresistant glucokinase family)